jgi:hypothetical protein
MTLSIKALALAFAVLEAAAFLWVAIMNLVLRPYGGAYLAILTSLYPGYDPVENPLSIVIGALYALIAGAIKGALLAWLYNIFAGRLLDRS